jgi:hypothetical protein
MISVFAVIATAKTVHSAEAAAFNEVYIATHDACSKMPSESLTHHGLQWDEYWAGKFPSPKMNKLLGGLVRESFHAANEDFNFTQETGTSFSLVRSSDFLTALDQCYGTDQLAKNEFIRLVKQRDKVGKTLAIAGRAAMLFVGAGALLKLASVSRVAARTVGWGLTTLGAYGFYELYQMRQQSLAQCEKQLPNDDLGHCLQTSLQDFSEFSQKNKRSNFTNSDVREFIRIEIASLMKRRAETTNPDEIRKIDLMLKGQLQILSNLSPAN